MRIVILFLLLTPEIAEAEWCFGFCRTEGNASPTKAAHACGAKASEECTCGKTEAVDVDGGERRPSFLVEVFAGSSTVLGARFDASGNGTASEEAAGAWLGLGGVVEWPLLANLVWGVGAAFHSLNDPFGLAGPDRSLINPHLRLAARFPVADWLEIEAALDAGGGLLSSDGADSQYGWTRRLLLGVAYPISNGSTLVASIGQFQLNALPVGDGSGTLTVSQTQGLVYGALLLGVGIRSK